MTNIFNLIDDLQHVAELKSFVAAKRIAYNDNTLNHVRLEVDLEEFTARINDAVHDLMTTLARYEGRIYDELIGAINAD